MTRHGPLDVRCPTCGSQPGTACTWTLSGTTVARPPHPQRRDAAATATARTDPTRCHRCGRPWTAHAQRHQAQT